MSPESRSALKVQYDLRPAKQVERRMLVDAFQRLIQAGFRIRDYRYVGFGSLHFIDFIIFHKLLGINDMLSIEYDQDLEKRVKYNSPFECIDIIIDSATNVIPTLSPDDKHILWLDYDGPVAEDVINDVYLAGSQLSRGSIILITVDVEPPVKDTPNLETTMEYFKKIAGRYLGIVSINDFAESKLYRISKKVIINALKEGMAGRRNIIFHPLFYFVYADGHSMMTVGGIIGGNEEKLQLKSVNTQGAFYFRRNINQEPYEINVPIFTRRERHLMDSAMPCSISWQPEEFTVRPEDINAYREIYRFLPAYAELLL